MFLKQLGGNLLRRRFLQTRLLVRNALLQLLQRLFALLELVRASLALRKLPFRSIQRRLPLLVFSLEAQLFLGVPRSVGTPLVRQRFLERLQLQLLPLQPRLQRAQFLTRLLHPSLLREQRVHRLVHLSLGYLERSGGLNGRQVLILLQLQRHRTESAFHDPGWLLTFPRSCFVPARFLFEGEVERWLWRVVMGREKREKKERRREEYFCALFAVKISDEEDTLLIRAEKDGDVDAVVSLVAAKASLEDTDRVRISSTSL